MLNCTTNIIKKRALVLLICTAGIEEADDHPPAETFEHNELTPLAFDEKP